MEKIKAINDFGHNKRVGIDIDFGYSSGVFVNMRMGNRVRSLFLNDGELSNSRVDFLTVLELMYEELLVDASTSICEKMVEEES